LLKAPEDKTGFVTSDHPVVLQWQDTELRNRLYPPGLGLKNTEILFPICNTLAVLGTFEGDEEIQIDASSELIAKFNGGIISRSKYQIYAKNSDFLYKFNDKDGIRTGETLSDHIISQHND
jgi:hypothetical protein